MTLEEGR